MNSMLTQFTKLAINSSNLIKNTLINAAIHPFNFNINNVSVRAVSSSLYWKCDLVPKYLGKEKNEDVFKPYETLATKQEWFLERVMRKCHFGPKMIRFKRKHPTDNRPQMKGVVLKTLIKKPRKPNSANRKCVLLRMSNGKEKVAHVPGVGHNLQEHSVVLVQARRTQDVPGLRLKVIRGLYDCAPLSRHAKYLARKNQR